METTITLKIVFSVTFHLELHNAISINCISYISTNEPYGGTLVSRNALVLA